MAWSWGWIVQSFSYIQKLQTYASTQFSAQWADNFHAPDDMAEIPHTVIFLWLWYLHFNFWHLARWPNGPTAVCMLYGQLLPWMHDDNHTDMSWYSKYIHKLSSKLPVKVYYQITSYCTGYWPIPLTNEQKYGALMFALLLAWKSCWSNSREAAGDLRYLNFYVIHYNVDWSSYCIQIWFKTCKQKHNYNNTWNPSIITALTMRNWQKLAKMGQIFSY